MVPLLLACSPLEPLNGGFRPTLLERSGRQLPGALHRDTRIGFHPSDSLERVVSATFLFTALANIV